METRSGFLRRALRLHRRARVFSEEVAGRRGDAKAEVTFAKALKKHFDDLDKSGGGDLSKKEVKQALQSFARKDKAASTPSSRNSRRFSRTWTVGGDDRGSCEEICDYIDERVDGKRRFGRTTRSPGAAKADDEADPRKTFAKALKKHFDDLDKSGDGDLSMREVKQASRAGSRAKINRTSIPQAHELTEFIASIFADMDLDGEEANWTCPKKEVKDLRLHRRARRRRRRRKDDSDDEELCGIAAKATTTTSGPAQDLRQGPRSTSTTSTRAVMGICRRRR